MTFLNTLCIYATILFITTLSRKYLTYKGVKVVLISTNFILLGYCTIFWNTFVLNSTVEYLALKLNPNTWTGIIYSINFKINALSFLFIFLVVIIGCATNIYALNYFKYEEREEEFILLINWFILSMLILVCGNNFFTIILGWELIGLTSFLLINFWKFKATTLGCSFKAFTFNKFSDLLLLVSFCSLWNVYQINDIDSLLTAITYNTTQNNNLLIFSAISLIICSCIKSAQIVGHLWLPESMEAPVPASSLIHSATLVSAGIFLILKFQTIFVVTNLLNILFLIGSLTACYGGLIAASQSDVKKLLAYSTVSHCGFIVSSIALNNIVVTITYLYLHGLYKAVTFFCVGSLIKYNNTQDMRLMGSSKTQLLNTITLLLASLNLGGLPFLLGYLYKQIFLLSLVNTNFNMLGYGFCIIGMLTSPVYVFKLNYYANFDFRKGFLQSVFLLIQNQWNNVIKFHVNFTYVKFFAFLLIYTYSLFFFIITKYYILSNYTHHTITPNTITNNLQFMSLNIQAKQYLIKIYYMLFTLTIITLIVQKNRTNYFYMQYFELISSTISFILFLNFIFFFSKFILLILNYVKLYLYIVNTI